MKQIAALIVLGLALMPLCAQEKVSAEQIKLAGEILELNGTTKNLERAVKVYRNRCDSLIDRYLARAKDQKAADKVKEELKSAIKEEMNLEEVKSDTAKIYAERFSVEELKAIAAFYNSDVGKKMRLLNDDMTRDINAVLNKHSREADERAKEILKAKVPAQEPVDVQIKPIGRIPAAPPQGT